MTARVCVHGGPRPSQMKSRSRPLSREVASTRPGPSPPREQDHGRADKHSPSPLPRRHLLLRVLTDGRSPGLLGPPGGKPGALQRWCQGRQDTRDGGQLLPTVPAPTMHTRPARTQHAPWTSRAWGTDGTTRLPSQGPTAWAPCSRGCGPAPTLKHPQNPGALGPGSRDSAGRAPELVQKQIRDRGRTGSERFPRGRRGTVKAASQPGAHLTCFPCFRDGHPFIRPDRVFKPQNRGKKSEINREHLPRRKSEVSVHFSMRLGPAHARSPVPTARPQSWTPTDMPDTCPCVHRAQLCGAVSQSKHEASAAPAPNPCPGGRAPPPPRTHGLHSPANTPFTCMFTLWVTTIPSQSRCARHNKCWPGTAWHPRSELQNHITALERSKNTPRLLNFT